VGGSNGNGRYIHIRFQVHMYVTKAHIGGVGVDVGAFVVSLTAFYLVTTITTTFYTLDTFVIR